MAIVIGKATKVSFNGVDIGECSFRQTQPDAGQDEPTSAAPNAVEVTVNMTFVPGGLQMFIDWFLRRRLGKYYKN